MWQFVLNRVEQIFGCMFMSGSSDCGSCANLRTSLPEERDHKFIGWFVTFTGAITSIAK